MSRIYYSNEPSNPNQVSALYSSVKELVKIDKENLFRFSIAFHGSNFKMKVISALENMVVATLKKGDTEAMRLLVQEHLQIKADGISEVD